jgi:hypothetical protein
MWHAGRLRFVATLAAKDDNLRQANNASGQVYGDWLADLGSRTAQVAVDSAHLVFESTQQLTGYDNGVLGPELEGQGGLEVFVYSAATGRLSCASCDPSGAPPSSTIDANNGTGGGTHLPVSTATTFMRRWMSADGSEVFFDSSQPLVTRDTNGVQDVYEWEAEGAPSCPDKIPPRLDGGCVFLLSEAEGNDFSYLVDASANGSDVFITHRGPLGGVGPRDDKTHLYDVRVNGGFPETSLACTGTGCQGVPPAPPSFASPPSVTFSGIGNFPPPPATKSTPLTRAQKLRKALRVCSKHRQKKRLLACERLARKRYGTVKLRPGKQSNKRGK